jgi:hypothetical protein
MLIYFGLTSRGEMAVMTFGKALESDSHVRHDYITTGRARVEMSYHYRFAFRELFGIAQSRHEPTPFLNREDEADIAEQ